ncbi:MFS transporter [Rhodococcus sp. Z13]|uniref:MFS transporter n=1 Tax=Rhodococcus sacchari TaxID=2962047 RepID=A0ACD4DLD4_9NOCA|nr:MFS transporter [Rhodococcus sp. Z13]UYP20880.1 MFS transporter [Rhodococcus sp. Z13]
MPSDAQTTAQPTRVGMLRSLEPWFSAYALAGLLVNGIVPLLIPLTVTSHGAAAVATVLAAFFTGQLFAPVIGRIADRTGTQRLTFLGSFPVMGAAAIGFGLSTNLLGWCVSAVLAGASAGAVQTLGSVFIVEGHPASEWDERIGWFRLVFGIGQVSGLAIGAVFAERHVHTGWLVAGGVILLGTWLGRLRLPHLNPAQPEDAVAADAAAAPASGGLRRELQGPFGRFLLSWFLAMTAVQTFLNVMPLVMKDAFDVSASRTATCYLVASALGACLYPICGELAKRHGCGWVLRLGLVITLAGLLAMTGAWIWQPPGASWIGIAGLVLVAFGYPFDYIGATMMAADLTLDGQGSAMGLFNSAVAAGAILGATVPSVLAAKFGYGALTPLAAGLVVVSLLVGARVFAQHVRKPA